MARVRFPMISENRISQKQIRPRDEVVGCVAGPESPLHPSRGPDDPCRDGRGGVPRERIGRQPASFQRQCQARRDLTWGWGRARWMWAVVLWACSCVATFCSAVSGDAGEPEEGGDENHVPRRPWVFQRGNSTEPPAGGLLVCLDRAWILQEGQSCQR